MFGVIIAVFVSILWCILNRPCFGVFQRRLSQRKRFDGSVAAGIKYAHLNSSDVYTDGNSHHPIFDNQELSNIQKQCFVSR